MPKRLPKISIVTPSYNQGTFIERTISSVLSQKYPNLEFIIMDGKSTDQTVSILKKYSSKLIWESKKDGGQTQAINEGLRKSTGEILAYLNSDDTYAPHTLHTIAHFFQTHPEEHFVYGHGRLIDSDDNEIGFYNDSAMTNESLFAACGISQPTCFWRRDVLEEFGYFDESYRFTMDYEYWVRVSKKFKLHYLPIVLANSRIHPDAKTSSFTHKLHSEALRVSLTHYGRVHYDWIFTYTDSAYSGQKGSKEYYRFMLIRSLVNYWKYNHSIPPIAGRKILMDWLKQAI
ncbi:MAG: glycosyltransferase family 2 protein [Candidatus Woesebacteria bacterium]